MSMLDEARREAAANSRDRSFMGRLKDIVPWKGDDLRELIRKSVFIVAVCVLAKSGYDAYIYNFGSKDMINDQQYISNLFNNPDSANTDSADKPQENTPAPDSGETAAPENPGAQDVPAQTVTESKYPEGMMANFQPIYDINPDVVGYISIDGIYIDDSKPEDERELAINYAVVQSDDNDYYLSHDIYRQEKDYGALYIDYRATVAGENRSSNVTIYGHDMKTGYYFGSLDAYKKGASFVSEHRIVDFSTLYEREKYVIFAAFLVSVHEEDDNQPIFRYHNCVEFNNDAEFDYWYKNVMYRNYYKTDIDCNIDDEYLTLSTCSNEIYDSRFVIVARKVREGEDPSVYEYRSNPRAHKPAKLYTAYGNEAPVDDGPDYEVYKPE